MPTFTVKLRWTMEQRSQMYGIRLTPREKEILDHILNGWKTKQIADKLHISANTVYNHRKKLLKKKGVKTSRQLFPIGTPAMAC